MLDYVVDQVFDKSLCHIHVFLQITKSHFWFNHPEFTGVSRGVGVLCTKSGAKCVNVRHGACEHFCCQLATHCQVTRLFKEILAIINLPVFQGRFGRVDGGDLEHFSSAFTITGSDDGGVDVNKIPSLKKLMHGMSQSASDPEDAAKQVGSRAKMCNLPEEFQTVPLFL